LILGAAVLYLGRSFWPWPILPLGLLAVVVSFHLRFYLTHSLDLARPVRVALEAAATVLSAVVYLGLARLPVLPVSVFAVLAAVAISVLIGSSEHWLSREDLGRKWT
jgi:type III secretory pathway component EscV